MPHEPKRRHSTERKGKRRASIKLLAPKGIICAQCGKTIKAHNVCQYCGFYKGKQVLATKK